MAIEFETTLKCNFNCKYCTNGRNTILEKPIFEASWKNVKKFLQKIVSSETDMLYLFGGEPFLCKNFTKIIEFLNRAKYPYYVQTNFSLIDKLDKEFQNTLKCPQTMNISFHSSQVKDIDKYIFYIKKYFVNIQQIDVMYDSDLALKNYFVLHKYFKNKVFLVPLADFKTDMRDFLPWLLKYNDLKRRLNGAINFEIGNRSYLWELEFTGKLTFKGKPCPYIDGKKYRLFAPDLTEYNCSHRLNTVYCPNETCFIM